MKLYAKNFKIKLITALCIVINLPDFSLQTSEVYEPAKTVCEKCKCRNNNNSMIIDCTNQNMTHVLNKWPEETNHLVATFSWNNFSELQQIAATDATTVSLSFSHCGVEKLTTAMFIDVVGIEFLDFSWNNIPGYELTPDIFRGRYSDKAYEPISLKQLDLSHNKIESLRPKVFEHTPNLTILNLEYNPLQIIDLTTSHAISSALKLSILNLAHTNILTFPEQMITRLTKLRQFDVSGNGIKVVPQDLSFLSNSLEILKLGENPIEYFDDNSFMGLHMLRELNISGMPKLTTIKHNTFSKLKKLKMLNCSNNPNLYYINNQAFGIKENRPQLKELYLSNNNLETLSPEQLHWASLTVLDLSGNRWLCDCTMYKMLKEINRTSDVISFSAVCSQPEEMNGIAMNEIEALENYCRHTVLQNDRLGGNPHYILMQSILIIASITLVLMGVYTFWKVMLKYKTIRSINTAYPVIYYSAPTEEPK